jgi:hypothetical protein
MDAELLWEKRSEKENSKGVSERKVKIAGATSIVLGRNGMHVLLPFSPVYFEPESFRSLLRGHCFAAAPVIQAASL